jgi:hypothetical protein
MTILSQVFKRRRMKKFIVERTIPGAGAMTQSELAAITKKSTQVANDLDKPYHWIQSYVTDDKVFCVHIAPDKETVLKHSAMTSIPADNVYKVCSVIDPSTGG